MCGWWRPAIVGSHSVLHLIAGVASVACILLPAGVPEYFWVYPGERVAVVQNAAAGSLNIAEMVA